MVSAIINIFDHIRANRETREETIEIPALQFIIVEPMLIFCQFFLSFLPPVA